jgi:uncharacterized membrane protein HdeD (DUF308 family)
MLVSAIASIVLAIAIIMGLPGNSNFVLGIVLGVNFITSGVAYFLLGRSAKKALT